MATPDLAILIGTRPEAIKLAPVVMAAREASLNCVLVSSGQHRDLLALALKDFGLSVDRDLAVMKEGQPLDELVATLLQSCGTALTDLKPRLLLVQGDTATAFAGALAAFHAKLPCVHVEAGLRSGRRDAPWPEEVYRQMADRLCTRLYAPTEGARKNLLREGLDASSIVVTGQTGVDAALWVSRRTRLEPAALPKLAPSSLVVFATLHRREGLARVGEIAKALAGVAADRADLEIVLPMHPNPEVRRQLLPLKGTNPKLHLIEPLSYSDAIALLSRASLVVTDSGGIQEEAPSFGVPVLVARDVTERPEGVAAGFLRVVGTQPEHIATETRRALDDKAWRASLASKANPYGDGKAAARIVADLRECLTKGTPA